MARVVGARRFEYSDNRIVIELQGDNFRYTNGSGGESVYFLAPLPQLPCGTYCISVMLRPRDSMGDDWRRHGFSDPYPAVEPLEAAFDVTPAGDPFRN